LPERGFNTETWHDDWFQELSWEQKYLFIYLWTNSHCNQAGLYQITILTMAFETKITKEDLPQLLKSLSPKVEWFPEHNLVWVRSFLRHQAKSSKFVVAAIKSLNGTNIPEDVRADFEFYNQNLLRGVAPSEHISLTKRECVLIRDGFRCQYCGKEIDDASDYEMDHIIPAIRGGKDNYLNLVASCRSCNQKKLDKMPSEVGLKEPHPSTFHGAQATYILRNEEPVRRKWLEVFPERVAVVESILGNIESGYPSNANASAISISDKKVGVVKGEEDSELAQMVQLYEQHIGILTPGAAGKLKDMRARYPPGWFHQALQEAVARGHHNLRYIEAVLESWSREGRKPLKKGETSGKPKQKRVKPIKYIPGSGKPGAEDAEDMP